ncbi:hypothetical protein [Streptomyces decoyicus]
MHTQGAIHALARCCFLDAWSVHILTLRATYWTGNGPNHTAW